MLRGSQDIFLTGQTHTDIGKLKVALPCSAAEILDLILSFKIQNIFFFILSN